MPRNQAPALMHEPSPPADSDYDSILAAVMETARGRWFLHEYIRRHRTADTGTLLAAIERIESLLMSREGEQPAPEPEVATLSPPAAAGGSNASMTADLRAVRDQFRDIADSLIECGAPSFLCNDLKRRIQELSRVCDRFDAGFNESPAVDSAEAIAAPAPAETAEPIEIAEQGQRRDPFADIRALSDIEKIALFT